AAGGPRDQTLRRCWAGRTTIGRTGHGRAWQCGTRRHRRRPGRRHGLHRAPKSHVQGRIAAMERSLRGKVLVMSGGSRGIGLAIAVRAARDGARVAIIAKTEEPHPRLEGTIYSAAEEIRE